MCVFLTTSQSRFFFRFRELVQQIQSKWIRRMYTGRNWRHGYGRSIDWTVLRSSRQNRLRYLMTMPVLYVLMCIKPSIINPSVPSITCKFLIDNKCECCCWKTVCGKVNILLDICQQRFNMLDAFHVARLWITLSKQPVKWIAGFIVCMVKQTPLQHHFSTLDLMSLYQAA